MKCVLTFIGMLIWLWSGPLQAQPGLKGAYYNGTNFERKVLTRIDPAIGFNWRNRNPAPGVNQSYYSIRWTGKLLAPVTGRYTFFAKVDDGIRIWVGNKKVMDVWQLNDSKSFTGSVILQAGQYYDLRVDFFNDLLEGEIFLYWRIPDPQKSLTDFSHDTGEPIAAQYFWQTAPPVAAPPKPVHTVQKTPSVKPPKAVAITAKPLVRSTLKPIASVVPKPVVAKPIATTPASPGPSEPVPTAEPSLTLKPGETFILHNVQFEQSSYVLLPESSVELNKLVQALKRNPQWQLEIGGHTDNVGDARLNRALSENRAKIVANYLIRSGIAEDRIDAKGYGSSQPIADNSTETERVKNRRVTICIR